MEDQDEEKTALFRCTGGCGTEKPKESYTTSQWAKGATHRRCMVCTKAAPHVLGDEVCARPMCHRPRLRSHLSLCAVCATGAECKQLCGPHPDMHTTKCRTLQTLRTMKHEINSLIGHVSADLPLFGDDEDREEYQEAVRQMAELVKVDPRDQGNGERGEPTAHEPTAGGGGSRKPGEGRHQDVMKQLQEGVWAMPDPPPCRGCVTKVCTRLSTPSMARQGVMLCEFCGPAPCGCCDCQNCSCD